MNRRRLLAGLGAGGLCSLLGRPRLARAAAEADPLLIVYFVKGGWDPTYVFDPHFGASTVEGDPSAEEATLGGLSFAAAASRPAVSTFFDAYGAQSVIVNGVAVGSISHVTCTRLMYTGSRADRAADVACALGASLGGELPLPNLILSGPRFPGPYGASAIPLSPLLFGTATGALPASAAYSAEDEAAIREFLAAEAGRLTFPQAEALGQSHIAALERRAVLESVATHFAGYVGATEAEQVAAALTALSLGLTRCVSLQGDSPERSQWDSHQDNAGNQDRSYEHLFTNLGALLSGLAATPGPGGAALLDQTTVLVLSEMGRTPVENDSGGKDHWPYTSALLVGAHVQGGQVVGATDETLIGLPVDPFTGSPADGGARITPASLLGGLLSRFGVDPGPIWPDVEPFAAPWS